MSRRKQRSAFDQVSEFDRERIVAYRDCGLSFREIGSRVGRNRTIVMRICDCWIQTLLRGFGWDVFGHPSYSPDLTPSDFHLFLHLKSFLAGKHFNNDKELKENVSNWLKTQAATFYEEGIEKLVPRYDTCLQNFGSYVERPPAMLLSFYLMTQYGIPVNIILLMGTGKRHMRLSLVNKGDVEARWRQFDEELTLLPIRINVLRRCSTEDSSHYSAKTEVTYDE
ncbi:histone-lysine N-methyltransferase SETMAR [Trichonephila clavipes]|nr:histone-lysine N-methyltransferase SETMAR [Trichonephila clavipes]